MRVVVIGERGQLASCLRASASSEWTFLGRAAIDLSRPVEISTHLDRHAPDIIVNAAAYTDVDRAETERDLAFAVNGAAPAALSQWCAANDAALIHISTDYVFDGASERPWREDDEPRPLNVYGASKLAGDRAVYASGARTLILRTSWLHGPSGRNFVGTMLRLAAEQQRIGVVADQRGAPTSAQDLADAITALLPLLRTGQAGGLYHCAAAGSISWAGFAEAIFADAFARGLIPRIPVVQHLASAQYPTKARRPLNCLLSSQRLLAERGIALPDWRLGLQHTLDALAAQKGRAS